MERAQVASERKKQLTKLRIKVEKVVEEKLGSQLNILTSHEKGVLGQSLLYLISKGRKSEARGKGIALPQFKDLILQPPSVAILEEDHMQIRMIPMPPKLVWRELHDTDSERTISTTPSTSNSHMVGPSTSSSGQSSHNKTFIHPIDNTMEKSCTSPVSNEKTSSEASSAIRSLLLSSALFLSQAEELFITDARQPAEASFKHDCSQNGMVETKLLLDCACELLNNKKAQCTLSFNPLSSKPVRRSRVCVSLDMLVSEICEAIECLRRYKDPVRALCVDTLCSLTRKDQWCKGVVSGT
nr:uncharacterized protein LOC109186411 isoform X3 [Ipomoea batatas]